MVHYNSRNEVSDIKNIKQKILPASLCGAAVGFTWFFFGAVDTFAGNRGEFLFSFSDFGWQLALIALAASLVIALALLFTTQSTGFFSEYSSGLRSWVMFRQFF